MDDPAPTTSLDGLRVSVRDPGGLVAAVPYLVGHRPARSLVVVGLTGGAVRFAARVDHRPGEPVERTRATWRHLREVLHRNGCSLTLVAVYGEHEPDALPGGYAGSLLATVLAEGPPAGSGRAGADAGVAAPLADDGADVLDVVVVGPTRFRSLLCDDTGCCPVAGRPTAPLEHHPVAAAFVLQGRVPAADRDSVEPVPAPAPPAARAAAQRAGRAEAIAARRSGATA
ncbi:DUF4192 family protein, partial [Aquipuribacter sp. SD81]|uniref:DUF4192 family protein n=1 Tax=Aquipuribacter sp. SD81 TaxID=3127703 RepID=UPI003015D1C5